MAGRVGFELHGATSRHQSLSTSSSVRSNGRKSESSQLEAQSGTGCRRSTSKAVDRLQPNLMTLIPLHVLGGAVAILSGLAALFASKGGPLHRKSGTVFVYAMLVMSLSGAIIAVGREGAAINIPAGLVTAYLAVTALLTVRAPSERSRKVERAAMVAAFVLSAGSLISAIITANSGQAGFVFPVLMFGLLALFGGVGDRRMLRVGVLPGRERLRRHLWRMCTGLFVAAASFFLGPVRRIPEPLRLAPFRLIPLLVLVTMVYWLWRYRRKHTALRQGLRPWSE